MNEDDTDLIRIAKTIEEVSLLLSANTHEHVVGDSVTMVKDGFIKAQVRLARLATYVRGLDSTHKELSVVGDDHHRLPNGDIIMHGGGRD